jgi:NADPH:quinone reductase-like Zn-dependent oxidoreductase
MADLPTTMRAAVVEKLEGPGALSIVERPVPSPGPGEVLIKVEAAGLNYADVAQSAGAYPGGPAAPYISGVEACGEVVAVGEGAGYRVGDKVIGRPLPTPPALERRPGRVVLRAVAHRPWLPAHHRPAEGG